MPPALVLPLLSHYPPEDEPCVHGQCEQPDKDQHSDNCSPLVFSHTPSALASASVRAPECFYVRRGPSLTPAL